MMAERVVLDAVGIFLMALAVAHVWVKVGVWIAAGEGASGGAPELDGVIFPPLLFTFGLTLLVHHAVSFWDYCVIWAVLTTLLLLLMQWMFKVGERRPYAPVQRQRKRKRHL